MMGNEGLPIVGTNSAITYLSWTSFSVIALQETFCVTEPEHCAFVFWCLTSSSLRAE